MRTWLKNTKDWANRIYDYCNIDEKYDSFNRKQFFSRTASKNQVTKMFTLVLLVNLPLKIKKMTF